MNLIIKDINKMGIDVTDIVILENSLGELGAYIVITSNHASFALMCLGVDSDSDNFGVAGNDWNGWFKTLDELYQDCIGDIVEHYSSDDYELILQKKRKSVSRHN